MKILRRLPFNQRLILFAILSALIAGAAYFSIIQANQQAEFARFEKSEKLLLQIFKTKIEARINHVMSQIHGADLLITSKPLSAAIATKALIFALRKDSYGQSNSAAVVLDGRARILDSRRGGGVPMASVAEQRVWSRSVAALRNEKKSDEKKFHIEPGFLDGVPALFFTVPSQSTRGYLGVILILENLFSLSPHGNRPGDSLFLLSEPEQTVFYALAGNRFVHDSIGRPFDKRLGPRIEILVCCDPAAFNTVQEGRRWMGQLNFSVGTRDVRLVRVAVRNVNVPDDFTQLAAGGVFSGWVLLLVIFSFVGRGRRTKEEYPKYSEASSGKTYNSPPKNTPFATLSRICESVARGDHFRDVITYGVEETARYLGADRYFAALYDDDLDQLFEISCSNLSDGFRATVAIGAGDLPEHISMREKDLVEVPSVDDWDDAPKALRDEGIKAVAIFPMRAREKVVGMMAFYFDGPRELQSDEIEICSYVSLQGAVAVAQALSLSNLPSGD